LKKRSSDGSDGMKTLLEMLEEVDSFSLAMAPGFFRKYAYCGALSALEDAGLLFLDSACGASAGAIVAGMLGCGKTPNELRSTLFALERRDIWDPSFFTIFFGFLKGVKLQETLERYMDIKQMENSTIPIGVTAFDIMHFCTKILQTGSLVRNVAASCSVPVMFQPVMIDGSPCVDGGVFDNAGIMALPLTHQLSPSSSKGKSNKRDGRNKLLKNRFVVNIMADESQVKDSILPSGIETSRTTLLTIVLKGVPHVSPFSMKEGGPLAFDVAKIGLVRALRGDSVTMSKLSHNHYLSIVDCFVVNPTTLILSDSSSNIIEETGKMTHRRRSSSRRRNGCLKNKCDETII